MVGGGLLKNHKRVRLEALVMIDQVKFDNFFHGKGVWMLNNRLNYEIVIF